MNFEKIFDILINNKPEYKNAINLKIESISGGISNKIFKISADNFYPILLRLYGDNMNNLIDRNEEIEIFKFISDNNLGPKLLGVINNGRFEEYYLAKSLNEKSIVEYRTDIIKKIKEINKLNYNGNLICWDRLYKWNNLLKNHDFTKDIDILKNRIKLFPSNHFLLEQVFCHNDLLPENILINNEVDVKIIDFEYAGNNYLGFELANHIIYYSFEDRTNENQQIYDFLQEYLNKDPSDLDLLIMFYFIKVTYLTWFIWGLISINNSDIRYDFQKYVNICYQNYIRYD